MRAVLVHFLHQIPPDAPKHQRALEHGLEAAGSAARQRHSPTPPIPKNHANPQPPTPPSPPASLGQVVGVASPNQPYPTLAPPGAPHPTHQPNQPHHQSPLQMQSTPHRHTSVLYLGWRTTGRSSSPPCANCRWGGGTGGGGQFRVGKMVGWTKAGARGKQASSKRSDSPAGGQPGRWCVAYAHYPPGTWRRSGSCPSPPTIGTARSAGKG